MALLSRPAFTSPHGGCASALTSLFKSATCHVQIAAGLPTAAGPTVTDESHNNTGGGAEGARDNGDVETAAEADDGGAISARPRRDLGAISALLLARPSQL